MSNLLGSLMNNTGSGNMANLATSLVAQVWQYRLWSFQGKTIQMKLILLIVWAEWAVFGTAKIALKFQHKI